MEPYAMCSAPNCHFRRNNRDELTESIVSDTPLNATQSKKSWLILIGLIVIIDFLLFGLFCFFYRYTSEFKAIFSDGEEIKDDTILSLSKRSVTRPSLLNEQLLGLESVQLTGAVPTLHVKTNGTVGPWTIDNKGSIGWAELNFDKTELRILQSGMYFITVQLFYLTFESSNSYEILRLRKTQKPESLSTCASQAAATSRARGISAEVTCCTAVVAYLDKHDHLRINQIEQNRVILLSKALSHWSVIQIHGGG